MVTHIRARDRRLSESRGTRRTLDTLYASWSLVALLSNALVAGETFRSLLTLESSVSSEAGRSLLSWTAIWTSEPGISKGSRVAETSGVSWLSIGTLEASVTLLALATLDAGRTGLTWGTWLSLPARATSESIVTRQSICSGSTGGSFFSLHSTSCDTFSSLDSFRPLTPCISGLSSEAWEALATSCSCVTLLTTRPLTSGNTWVTIGTALARVARETVGADLTLHALKSNAGLARRSALSWFSIGALGSLRTVGTSQTGQSRTSRVTCCTSLASGSEESRIPHAARKSVSPTVSSVTREAAEVVSRLTFLPVRTLESAVSGLAIDAGIAVRSVVAIEAAVTFLSGLSRASGVSIATRVSRTTAGTLLALRATLSRNAIAWISWLSLGPW